MTAASTHPTVTDDAAPEDAIRALRVQVQAARDAGPALARAKSAQKDAALEAIAVGLIMQRAAILAANVTDLAAAENAGTDAAILDRIRITSEKVDGLAATVRAIVQLPDPIGEIIDQRQTPSGLAISRVRVPLGVVASIYENRPNVTIDIGVLCLKSGNTCVLRGGREALHSNTIFAAIVRAGLTTAGLPADAVQLITNPDHALVAELLQLHDLIDLMVPRGGKALIERVRTEARMPIVAGGIGICHTYVDRAADTEMALAIVDNAKTRRVSICNAMDTLLVHQAIAPTFLPRLAVQWGADVELRADAEALAILQASPGARVIPADSDDFDTEFLAMVAAIRVVPDAEAAMAHIEAHGSGHSDAIVTNDHALAERFLREVDAAAVYVNASTQFTDGGEYGLGAEVGISTGKLHARGPMGLREMTSYKWVVRGSGQVRPR